jgi:hypothetical protein
MPLHKLARWLERVNAHPVMRWVVTVGIAVPLVLSVVVSTQYFNLTDSVRAEQHDRDRFTMCLASWADQYTARAERITKVNADTTAKTSAYIHALTVALGDAIAQDQAALTRDLPAYVKAATDYEAAARASKDALARNPIPDAPKFQCR